MAYTGRNTPRSRSNTSRRRRPAGRTPIGPPIGSGNQSRMLSQDIALDPLDSPLHDWRRAAGETVVLSTPPDPD